MSMNTWSRYVAMDDPVLESHNLEAAFDGVEEWEELDLDNAWDDAPAEDDAE